MASNLIWVRGLEPESTSAKLNILNTRLLGYKVPSFSILLSGDKCAGLLYFSTGGKRVLNLCANGKKLPLCGYACDT